MSNTVVTFINRCYLISGELKPVKTQSFIHYVQRPSGASKPYHLVPCSNLVSKSKLIPIKMKNEEKMREKEEKEDEILAAQWLRSWYQTVPTQVGSLFLYYTNVEVSLFIFSIIDYIKLNSPCFVIPSRTRVHCIHLHKVYGTFDNISWILSNSSKKCGVDYKISMQITVTVTEWVMSFDWKF